MPITGLKPVERKNSLTEKFAVFIVDTKTKHGEIGKNDFAEQKWLFIINGAVEMG